MLRPLLFVVLALAALSPSHAAYSRAVREEHHPELFKFPYVGRGNPDFSFRHPFQPSVADDPVDGWVQHGTAVVTQGQGGLDVVRLTGPGQAHQGLFHSVTKTDTNNFNAFFDIRMETVRESHEAADGMGFFFVKDKPVLGSAMGISDKSVGLGFIIDTFSNSRTRRVPYLYAYVSDGKRQWNPDLDGGDVELTRGCKLEMNTRVRVNIQYIDGNLHVGVALNPSSPHRWHTCFKMANVRLPFSDGGYFAFSGETGHFFAIHEVYNAAIVVEEHDAVHGSTTRKQAPSNADANRVQSGGDSGQRQQSKSTGSSAGQAPPVKDAASRVHRANDPTTSLSGSIDLQVYEVFNSVTKAISGLGDKESLDTKTRLNGVKDMVSQLVREVERQKTDVADLIGTLGHLKATAGDLSYSAERFSGQIKGMHSSIQSLKKKSDEMSRSHDDMHADVTLHHSTMLESGNGGHAPLVMFIVGQGLLVAAVVFVNRLTTANRKMGRMV